MLIKYLNQYGLKETELLKTSNYSKVSELVMDHVDELERYYTEINNVARLYFIQMIGSAKKICVSDLGWRGSEVAYIKYLVEEKWKLDVEVIGTVVTSTFSECSMSLLSRGVVQSFEFGNAGVPHSFSEELWEDKYMFVLTMEAIFTSQEPSLIRYLSKNGHIEFHTYDENPNKHYVAEIQNGITHFLSDFN